MRRLSFTLFALSIAMITVPLPAFLYLVKPYAASTRDPDAIEAPAWFLGIFMLLAGGVLLPVALGIWLHARQRYSGIVCSVVFATSFTSAQVFQLSRP
jgi:hypothetical protein